MKTPFGKLWLVSGLILALGGGCIAKESDVEAERALPVRQGAVQGESSEDGFNLPDGKGASALELCISTEAGVTGPVWLYAANATADKQNWSQWFSASPVVVGTAGTEMCGPLNFLVSAGDTVLINGALTDGQRSLVENRGSLTSSGSASGSDLIREIWIDDQYYAVGKECVYVANGKQGFDLACSLR